MQVPGLIVSVTSSGYERRNLYGHGGRNDCRFLHNAQ